ncbi:MAG: hydrogenase nickel incorporation protein HypA [Opitutales bacterium]|nr:hydrogenase nickel incorporation protein HypA [Opitutales bacterium]
MTLPAFFAFAVTVALVAAGAGAWIHTIGRKHIRERLAKSSTFHCLRCDSVYTSSESDLTAVCPKCGYKNTKLKF